MKFFVVTYVHHDLEGWAKHLDAHIEYLKDLVEEGTLRASGPTVVNSSRSAMLIMTADNKDQVLKIIEADPFKIHGLVDEMTITEWDPLFGNYSEESSRIVGG